MFLNPILPPTFLEIISLDWASGTHQHNSNNIGSLYLFITVYYHHFHCTIVHQKLKPTLILTCVICINNLTNIFLGINQNGPWSFSSLFFDSEMKNICDHQNHTGTTNEQSISSSMFIVCYATALLCCAHMYVAVCRCVAFCERMSSIIFLSIKVMYLAVKSDKCTIGHLIKEIKTRLRDIENENDNLVYHNLSGKLLAFKS